jgi:hypothetical protein
LFFAAVSFANPSTMLGCPSSTRPLDSGWHGATYRFRTPWLFRSCFVRP